MKYKPNPHLTDSQRLVVIETLLVNTLATQERQETQIERIQRVLLIATGFIVAAFGTTGATWITILNGG